MSQQSIYFQQHIRTSSKARRGFRTYQLSSAIDEATDEKLGGYGVYSPSAYANISAMKPEDYPELFMFYALGSKKVVCRSLYIGLDLHSYPPRAGNYISHALLYSGNQIFNPVEIYYEATWKTAEQVRSEDEGGVVPLEVGELLVDVEPDFYDGRCFIGLLLPDESQPASEKDGQEMQRNLGVRKRMFMMAVDAIINDQKVVILDEPLILIKWTLALLQVFPLRFVFDRLTITSFANSNLLLDVCRVLCFEKENAERAKRYTAKAVTIDFDNPGNQPPSKYAEVLLKAITANALERFRKNVFPKISRTNYQPADFNIHSLFYDQLYRIDEMAPEDFKSFFGHFVERNEQEYIDEIFQEVSRKPLIDKCPLIWYELKNRKPITSPHNLANYIYISQYVIPSLTDEAWVDFETEAIRPLIFNDVEEFDKFINVTKITHPKRGLLYYDKVIYIIQNTSSHDAKLKGAKSIRERIPALSASQEKELREIEVYLDIFEKITTAKDLEKYALFQRVFSTLNKQQVIELKIKLPPIGWNAFFHLLGNNANLLKSLYEIEALGDKLPKKDLAVFITENKYLEDNDRLYDLYRMLSPTEKSSFEKHAVYSIQKIIISKQPIDSAERLEVILKNYADTIELDLFLSDLTANCQRRFTYTPLWKLCSIIYFPNSYVHEYPIIVNRIKKADLKKVCSILDNEAPEIPETYERLAGMLHDDGLIKRRVPRHEMIVTSDELRSIGKLNELKGLKKILKERKFDHDVLLSLIRLPWLYYTWEVLFEQLEKEDKERLPNVLYNLLQDVEKNGKISRDAKPGYRYSHWQWKNIIFQYYVFIVLENKKEYFFGLVKSKIFISWEEFDYIHRTLSVIMNDYDNNLTYKNFIAPSNIIKSFAGTYRAGKGPIWSDNHD